eukprot:11847172-Alexandrium_andersonii.AAC.1
MALWLPQEGPLQCGVGIPSSSLGRPRGSAASPRELRALFACASPFRARALPPCVASRGSAGGAQ